MRNNVKTAIQKIQNFKNIDELHLYIINELNLDEFTDEEFIIIWNHMNKFDK